MQSADVLLYAAIVPEVNRQLLWRIARGIEPPSPVDIKAVDANELLCAVHAAMSNYLLLCTMASKEPALETTDVLAAKLVEIFPVIYARFDDAREAVFALLSGPSEKATEKLLHHRCVRVEDTHRIVEILNTMRQSMQPQNWTDLTREWGIVIRDGLGE